MTTSERTNATGEQDTLAATGANGLPLQEAVPGGSRARRVAFRVLAVLTSLWVLALMVFGLTEIVLMWLPADTLLAIDDSLTDVEAHRSHYMSIGIVSWAITLAVVVQVRRPHRREAAMVMAVAVAVASAGLSAISGLGAEWLLTNGTVLVVVLALAALHPQARELVRSPDLDRASMTLAVVAAVPWLIYAVLQVRHQWRNVAGDIHAEPEHWAIAALMALVIVAASVIGSSAWTGWRLPAWFAAVATVIYGVHSLAFASAASALPTLWAIAAIAWGIAYAVAVIRRGQQTRSEAAVRA